MVDQKGREVERKWEGKREITWRRRCFMEEERGKRSKEEREGEDRPKEKGIWVISQK